MIVCNLYGGLGNQMFQAAHALSQAWKKGVESKFKAESWTPMQGMQTDNYRNNIFRNLNFDNSVSSMSTTIFKASGAKFPSLNPLTY